MPTHTSLRGLSTIGEAGLSAQLEYNVLYFLQWGLLGLGAFATVERSQASASGFYGGDMSRLRLSEDPNYSGGQVWEGFRKDWVWETGIECSTQPIRVSGVWVNGTFHPTSGVGSYAHHVDYPNGRVVFNSPLPSSATVQASFSYRYVHLAHSDSPWWLHAHSESLRVDNSHFLQTGSGAWAVPAERRLQLPAIIVEPVTNFHQASIKPLALGGGRTVQQDIRLNILAETPADRNALHDLLVDQWEKRIHAFDLNRAVAATGLPLDYKGSPLEGPRMYPDMVKPYTEGPYHYGYNQIRVAETKSSEVDNEVYGLYAAIVRWTCEMDRP